MVSEIVLSRGPSDVKLSLCDPVFGGIQGSTEDYIPYSVIAQN